MVSVIVGTEPLLLVILVQEGFAHLLDHLEDQQ